MMDLLALALASGLIFGLLYTLSRSRNEPPRSD